MYSQVINELLFIIQFIVHTITAWTEETQHLKSV